MKTSRIIAFFALIVSACVARAEIIAYEPFNYKNGAGESLNGAGTGVGWGGDWDIDPPLNAPETEYSMYFRRLNYNGLDFNYNDTNGVAVPNSGNVYLQFMDSKWPSGNYGAPWWFSAFADRPFAETHYINDGESIWFSIIALQRSNQHWYSDNRQVYMTVLTPGTPWAIVGFDPSWDSTQSQWGIYTPGLEGKIEFERAAKITDGSKAAFLVTRAKCLLNGKFEISLWVNPEDISSQEAMGAPDVVRTDITRWGNEFYGFRLGVWIDRGLLCDEIRVGTTLRDVVKGDPYASTLVIIK
ncbi:MAG: hypothetical protein FWG05_03405 [Kiritimatiellaeota bacterium]|nr:hypothetical protein [Kiritimatiellota bacterium]